MALHAELWLYFLLKVVLVARRALIVPGTLQAPRSRPSLAHDKRRNRAQPASDGIHASEKEPAIEIVLAIWLSADAA